MTYGRKTGGRNFTKGNPGGPGRRPIPEEERQQRKEIEKFQAVARYRFAEAWSKLETFSISQLQSFADLKNPSTADVPVVELMLARMLLRAMNTGKPFDISQIREMMCGTDPKQIELSGAGGEPLIPFQGVPAADLVVVFREVQRAIQENECKSMEKPLQSLGSEPQLLAPSSPQPSDTAL